MSIYPRSIPLAVLLQLAACGPPSVPAGESSGDGSTVAAGSEVTDTSTGAPTTGGSTTASAGTEVSTSSTETTYATGFIFPVDGGGGCFAGVLPDGAEVRCSECDPFKQDCGNGDKCVPWARDGGSVWNALKCVKATGDGMVGDPCMVEGAKSSGFDDCALGHICWDVDDQLHGTCIAQCTGTFGDPQCAEGYSCVITNDGTVTVCLPKCDPLLQDCPSGDLCVPINDSGFVCRVDASGAEGLANDACDLGNECDPGLICINTAAASIACQQGPIGCCTPYCKFPGAPCPNPDQACVQWFDPMMPIPLGDEDIGVCAIPP